jgi:hypothetical protein
MSSKNYKKNGYGSQSQVAIYLVLMCVEYPGNIGCMMKFIRFRSTCLRARVESSILFIYFCFVCLLLLGDRTLWKGAHCFGELEMRVLILDKSKQLLWDGLGVGLRACHSCFIEDISRCHWHMCKTSKKFKVLSWKLKYKMELSEQTWVRGTMPMTRLSSSSSQPL